MATALSQDRFFPPSVVDDEGDLQRAAPFGDCTVGDSRFGILDPNALDAIDRLRGALNALTNRILNAFGGGGDNFGNFCNGHDRFLSM